MKRILLIAICAMLVISLAACAARNTEPAEEAEGGESVGGWTINTNNVASLSKEDENLFTMATASSDVLYEPIAKVATQVVAGTNHAFLCTANVDGDKWYFVTVYQPLDGDPEMIGASEFDVINYASIGEADGEAVGAWEVTEGGIYSLPSDAFSAYEIDKIPTVTVSADKNPNNDKDPGNATQDQVFLLSIPEVKKYFKSDSARECKPTEVTIANEASVDSSTGNCIWWLRTVGRYETFASCVDENGKVDAYGNTVHSGDPSIRPAIWIDLSKLK